MSGMVTIEEWAEEWLATPAADAKPLVTALLGHVRTQEQHYRRRFEAEVTGLRREVESLADKVDELSDARWL